MAVLRVVRFGEPILRRRADPVRRFDGRLQRLFQDLVETMEVNNGAGLAAPQIGVSMRACVVRRAEGGIWRLVNPKVVSGEGVQVGPEACLSNPGYWADVPRYANVVVSALGTGGKPVTIEAEGFSARCLQHEIDHLDGILYTDRALGEIQQQVDEPDALVV